MSSGIYSQVWCGQSQPHDPHVWTQTPTGRYASCAGHSAVVSPGPCWHNSRVPLTPNRPDFTIRCELPAGHEGAHTATPHGGEVVWTEADVFNGENPDCLLGGCLNCPDCLRKHRENTAP